MNKEKSGFSYLSHFLKGYEKSMYIAVILAILGSVCGMIPYFAVSAIITEILKGTLELSTYIYLGMIALLGQLGRLILSTISTNVAHETSFGIIKNIRDAITEKLSNVPMGYILNTPSGKFKTLFVDTVEKIELPISHMIPEITAGIVSGGAKWIDLCAKNYALEQNLKYTEFLPQYKLYGKSAPLKRNLEIINHADLVIAFWNGESRGTKFVIENCRKSFKKCDIIKL